MQVLHERYAAAGDTGQAMLSHDGEEAGVVVRGWIEMTVGGATRTHGPGDSYDFGSRLSHRLGNVGGGNVEL